MSVSHVVNAAACALKDLWIDDDGNGHSGVDLGFTSMLGDKTQLTVMLERVLTAGKVQIIAQACMTTEESDVLMTCQPDDVYTSYESLFAGLVEIGTGWNDTLAENWKTAFIGSNLLAMCTVHGIYATFDDDGEWATEVMHNNGLDSNSTACIACVRQALQLLEGGFQVA